MRELYDEDILVWSERQAARLRELAHARRNDTDIDWPHIIEEIEGVGRSEFHAVESHLILAMLHLLKVQAWPHSLAVPHWQAEARLFAGQAQDRFSPAMRQRLDLTRLYGRALEGLPLTIDGYPGMPLPTTCPWSLADLLAR